MVGELAVWEGAGEFWVPREVPVRGADSAVDLAV